MFSKLRPQQWTISKRTIRATYFPSRQLSTWPNAVSAVQTAQTTSALSVKKNHIILATLVKRQSATQTPQPAASVLMSSRNLRVAATQRSEPVVTARIASKFETSVATRSCPAGIGAEDSKMRSNAFHVSIKTASRSTTKTETLSSMKTTVRMITAASAWSQDLARRPASSLISVSISST